MNRLDERVSPHRRLDVVCVRETAIHRTLAGFGRGGYVCEGLVDPFDAG